MSIRIEYPKISAFDNNGDPAVGYKVYTYEAGTSTLTTTYSDRNLTSPNANPVILNARGEADIYVSEAIKLLFTIPTGDPTSPIWTVDYVGETVVESRVIGNADAGTTNNNYVVNTSPGVSALYNGLELVMIPDADNEDTIVSQSFTGTGINDGVFSGPYTGSTSGSIFTVQIDGVGSPNTFKWKKDGGAWTTGVAITTDAQLLIEGIIIDFAEYIGHTLNDLWSVTVQTPVRVNWDGLGNKIVYKNVEGILQALDGGDIKSGIPAVLLTSVTQNCYVLDNASTAAASSVEIPARVRREITGAYNLVVTDEGRELSCTGTFAITLLAPPDFANKFVYITNKSTGTITINAGAYNIYGSGEVVGTSTFSLLPGVSIQLGTNGVDWHILTNTKGIKPASCQVFLGNGTWTRPSLTKSIIVHVVSGGGGGAVNGGGGGGGYSRKLINVTGVTSVAVTVGAGGAGGSAGGTSSFGAYCSVTGGSAGSGAGVASGGAGSGGDVNINGGMGYWDNVAGSNGGWGGCGAGPFGGTGGTIGAGGAENGLVCGGGAVARLLAHVVLEHKESLWLRNFNESLSVGK